MEVGRGEGKGGDDVDNTGKGVVVENKGEEDMGNAGESEDDSGVAFVLDGDAEPAMAIFLTLPSVPEVAPLAPDAFVTCTVSACRFKLPRSAKVLPQ